MINKFLEVWGFISPFIGVALVFDYFHNKKIIRFKDAQIAERDSLLADADKELDRLVRLLNKATGREK